VKLRSDENVSLRLAAARVYLIVTEAACRGPWEIAVQRALSSGAVDVVQLREKQIDDREFARRAARLRAMSQAAHAVLIVNDRVHLVDDVGADGVHVGEHDATPEQARERLGPSRLVGVSTHDPAEVALAAGRGADYVGLGPCYATRTKALEREPRGPALVSDCAGFTTLPVFPIGGITPEHVPALVAAGATRVAVGAGVLGSDEPAIAARRIADALASPPPRSQGEHLTFGVRVAGRTYRARPGAYAVIVDESRERVGVVRTHVGLYLAGGGTNPGETAEDTLRREVREEIGYDVAIVRTLGFAIEFVETARQGGFAKECSFFEVRLARRAVEPSETDHELLWLPARVAADRVAHGSQAWAIRRALADTA
jgi:thiamine-phosphate pyrophosphorylase